MRSVQLFDHQELALEQLREKFRAGKRSVILASPTGSGKTEIAISMMVSAAAKGKRSAIVLDRITLCTQTSERLFKYGVSHGVLQSGHPLYRPGELIQVCSAQTLEARGSFPANLDLLIVDEAHITRKHTSDYIKANHRVKVVGLTATPFTKGLATIYDDICCPTTSEKLVDLGILVPLKAFIAKEIDMTGAKKVAGEWTSDEVASRGMRITGDIVSEWVAKTHQFFGGPKKTIVFCAGVAHGQDLQRKFASAGYRFETVSYLSGSDNNQQIIDDFKRPDTQIHGLIATDILTKGFDVPDVRIGISARPFSKSFSSHIQQIGRVIRSSPGKQFGLWLCHSGNMLRFMEDYLYLHKHGVHELNDSTEKPRKEKTQQEKEASKCPKCGALWIWKGHKCLHCGFEKSRANKVIEVPGSMAELTSDHSSMKMAWYSNLCYYAEIKGYKPGWVANKYKAKFGEYPSRSMDRMPITEMSKDVMSWIRHQNIKWAKGHGRYR
jgi:superfamily II DNA or RNA helicase